MTITVETAKVYKTSGGIRYLTKRAALIKEATVRLKRKHEPDGHNPNDGMFGRDYFTDEQWAKFQAIAFRYYRRFRKAVK